MIRVRRAGPEDTPHFKHKTCLDRGCAFIAEAEGRVVGSLAYKIVDHKRCKVVSYDSLDGGDHLADFIDYLTYWHPYLATYKFGHHWYPMKVSAPVYKVCLDQIVPEQLTVDQSKLDRVNDWLKHPEEVVVACVDLEGRQVCVDGYSRLLSAYEKGFSYVYAYEEKDYNEAFIRTCLSWCQEEGVLTLDDLSKRVVAPKDHQRLWIDRCQAYFKEKQS